MRAGDRLRSDSLATESAQFGYPEVQRGFVPALVMTMLRRTVSERSRSTSRRPAGSSTETKRPRPGLASRVYEDADFEEQAAEVLRVLAEASPSALAFTKQQFYQLDGLRFRRGTATRAPTSTRSAAARLISGRR